MNLGRDDTNNVAYYRYNIQGGGTVLHTVLKMEAKSASRDDFQQCLDVLIGNQEVNYRCIIYILYIYIYFFFYKITKDNKKGIRQFMCTRKFGLNLAVNESMDFFSCKNNHIHTHTYIYIINLTKIYM